MIYEPKRAFTPYISVGPVIGLVTETTCRVLFECSADSQVKCFATDAYGVQHGVLACCVANRATVVQFDELRAGTYYRITFDLPVPGLVKSGFRTLPPNWGSVHHPPKIAVVSNNDYVYGRDKVSHQNDLWKSIFDKSKRGEIDYCLHLGNIVYADNKKYSYTTEGRSYKGTDEKNPKSVLFNAFQFALNHCYARADEAQALYDSPVEDQNGQHQLRDEICDIFRNVYRDTWIQPCARHALANTPNLMILGDLEIGDYIDDDSTIHRLVRKCAYQVYNEYCRSLFENFVADRWSKTSRIHQAYHFHALGDVGFMFLDTHARKWVHRGTRDEEETPFLGASQWSDIEYALSPGGYFKDCKILFICTPDPIAQISESGYLKASTIERIRLLTTWNCPAAVAEASLLLSKLFDWKSKANRTRHVTLLCGSSTDSGITSITDNRYDQEEDRTDIKQITTGAISASNKSNSLLTSLTGYNSFNTGIGVYHTFKHNKITRNRRNYAIVGIKYSAGSVENNDEESRISTTLIGTTGETSLSVSHVTAPGGENVRGPIKMSPELIF